MILIVSIRCKRFDFICPSVYKALVDSYEKCYMNKYCLLAYIMFD